MSHPRRASVQSPSLLAEFRSREVGAFPVVGTGPYMMQSWQHGRQMVLVRNPNYFRPGLPHVPRVVIQFNVDHKAQEMPYFMQEILLQSQQRGPLTDQAYLDALALCAKLARFKRRRRRGPVLRIRSVRGGGGRLGSGEAAAHEVADHAEAVDRG